MTTRQAPQGISFTRDPQSKALKLVSSTQYSEWLTAQSEAMRQWLQSQKFQGKPSQFCLLPEHGEAGYSVLAIVDEDSPYSVAHLPKLLPKCHYHRCPDANAAISNDHLMLGWGLGAYRFERYLSVSDSAQLHAEAFSPEAMAVLEASLQVRNLINTPTEDMGPEQLQHAAQALADRFNAQMSVVIGDDLLTQNYPTVHAVGRASHRAPRVIRLDWGNAAHPQLVLCGKGVCFDTGGLDMKAAAGMRNMKKDMGGAAHALGLAQLIMQNALPVRLTVLIAAVENSVSGNAFRPGDIIRTRQGLSVEIHNTDAEGRLVLCDLLAEASAMKPDLIMDFATLTGAARIALGPDLPVLYCNRDGLAEDYMAAGREQHDPIWRLPLWQPYLSYLKSTIADLSNASTGTHAGSVTAALFLQCFVKPDIDWTHMDVYSWNDSERPGRPAGGEAQGLRAAFALLKKKYDDRH